MEKGHRKTEWILRGQKVVSSVSVNFVGSIIEWKIYQGYTIGHGRLSIETEVNTPTLRY